MEEVNNHLKKEIKNNLVVYITAAFGLVAGLAWNEAIKSLIDYLFPLEKNTLIAKFVYAFIITIVVVAASIILSKLLADKKENRS